MNHDDNHSYKYFIPIICSELNTLYLAGNKLLRSNHCESLAQLVTFLRFMIKPFTQRGSHDMNSGMYQCCTSSAHSAVLTVPYSSGCQNAFRKVNGITSLAGNYKKLVSQMVSCSHVDLSSEQEH